MANGRGGSRIGGFIRGVLAGLVVCAIAAVALSLSAPPPERGPIGGVPEVPDGAPAGEARPPAVGPRAAVPGSGTAPAAPEPAGDTTTPAAAEAPSGEVPAEGSVVPQATSPGSPQTGEAEPSAGESDAFTTPQSPTQ